MSSRPGSRGRRGSGRPNQHGKSSFFTGTRERIRPVTIKQTIFDAICFGYLLTIALAVITGVTEDDVEARLLPESWVVSSFLTAKEEAPKNQLPYAFVVLALTALGASLSIGINRAGFQTLGGFLFESPDKKARLDTEGPAKTWWKTTWGIQTIITFLVTFAAAIVVTEFSLYEIFSSDGFEGARRVFSSLATPNFAILPMAVLAILETIFMAFLATVLAVPAAFILSFFCAKNLMGQTKIGFAVYTFLRALLNITRSIEPLIWAIIFSVWVGIGPFAGMLALMLHTVASLAKLYSELVESIDDGPVDGILATGAGPLQVVWFAVVPQVILPYISFTIYRWDINVRMSTIIGLVGGGGIGTLIMQFQGQARWHEVGTLALVIVLTVWAMDVASAYIREAIK